MAGPPQLTINEAKWACVSRGVDSITVTDKCAKLVAERSAGRFLFIANAEKKTEYAPDPSRAHPAARLPARAADSLAIPGPR